MTRLKWSIRMLALLNFPRPGLRFHSTRGSKDLELLRREEAQEFCEIGAQAIRQGSSLPHLIGSHPLTESDDHEFWLCRGHDAVYHARRHSALRQNRSAKQTESHREPITTRRCSKAIPIGGVYLHPFRYDPIPEPVLKSGMTSFLAEDLGEQKQRLCDFRLGANKFRGFVTSAWAVLQDDSPARRCYGSIRDCH